MSSELESQAKVLETAMGAAGGLVGGVADMIGGFSLKKQGADDLKTANTNLDDLKAAQPSLDTPGAYYEQVKQAYDQRLMGMQVDSINRNLATTVDAASQYGARGLGAIGGATQAAQEAQRKEVLTQQQLQTQALSELAGAEQTSQQLKEQRSTRDIEYGYDAKVAAEAKESMGQQQMIGGAVGIGSGLVGLAGISKIGALDKKKTPKTMVDHLNDLANQ